MVFRRHDEFETDELVRETASPFFQAGWCAGYAAAEEAHNTSNWYGQTIASHGWRQALSRFIEQVEDAVEAEEDEEANYQSSLEEEVEPVQRARQSHDSSCCC